MLSDIDWPRDLTYSASSDYLPIEFYLSSFSKAKQYDLLLGYFSTSAISKLSLGFATFIKNGGTMRLVINHILSDVDREAIKAGLSGQVGDDFIDIEDPVWLNKVLSQRNSHFFECIAWLIHKKRIEIKIIRPKYGAGIAHYKQGVISDGTNKLSFIGSCNFTYRGLVDNLESLRVTLGWHNDFFASQVESDIRAFEKIFNENDSSIEYLSIDKTIATIVENIEIKDIDYLIDQESKLIEEHADICRNRRLDKLSKKLSDEIEKYITEPRFPYQDGPRPYQIEAYNRWIANERSGVLAMATGTGKTITALNMLLEEYRLKFGYQAIILVPTRVLVRQWSNEVTGFNFRDKIEISSDYPAWKAKLKTFEHLLAIDSNTSFVLVATYAALKSKNLRAFLKQHSSKMTLIADESHNIGAAETRNILSELKFDTKVALSATPSRKYDEEGTDFVDDYFRDSEPYIYSYPMNEAINNGVLVQYYYYPLIVELTNDEKVEYDQLSDRIRKLSFNADNKSPKKKNEALEILLLQRKSIIDKASNKFEAFKSIIRKLSNENELTYTLIYSSDGFVSEYADTDEYIESDEDLRNIDVYSSIVRSETGESVRIGKYTSQTKDREHLLQSFSNGSLNVLVSMKCLDEGVDVPKTRAAIFCSSSGNSRQFIQRRGRILRKAEGKDFAYIYDLVVVPPVTGMTQDTRNETSILRAEFSRVMEFAGMALNKYEALAKLESHGEKYGLDIYGI